MKMIRSQWLLAVLFAGRLAAASSDTNRVPDPQQQLDRARAWLATNTVAAGRTRGKEIVRRALLVGINTYRPTRAERASFVASAQNGKTGKGRATFNDLDGCVNDAEAMRALLVARYGFKPENILVLTNQLASRDSILSSIQSHLVAPSQSGDVGFFFYAGHGSQVVNTKSDEVDRRDETIVPADSWKGVPDIRDKELRPHFNAVLDKGATLTAIFDSCHSGSVARGHPVVRKTRYAEPILDDIADSTNYGRSPEERGALVIAAAQDDQLAEESDPVASSGWLPGSSLPSAGGLKDETQDGGVHGAFTAALLRVLRHAPLSRSAAEIFLSVSSTLQADGRNQIPVLSGIESRRQQGLFGETVGLSGRTAVSVLSVNETQTVNLQGGRAAGLVPGCRLRQLVAQTNQAPAIIEIASVDGLMRSQARLVTGDAANIRPGDVFEVSRWVVAPEAMLSVWLPAGRLSVAQWDNALKLAEVLRRSDRLEWVDDPTQTTPTHILSWDAGHWSLRHQLTEVARFEPTAVADDIIARLTPVAPKPRLFMSLPLEPALRDELKLGEGTEHSAVTLAPTPQTAQYLLVGAYRDGRVVYSWMLPNITVERAAEMPMPVRTDWFPTNRQADGSAKFVARQLEQSALQLGRIKSWLTLEAPEADDRFPYRLALKHRGTGALITDDHGVSESSSKTVTTQLRQTKAVVTNGQRFSLVLRTPPEAFKGTVEQRFVYVFVLDSKGGSELLSPPRGQGNAQRLPAPPVGSEGYPAEISLNSGFTVEPPFGIDTYVLLTSRTAIPDPTVLRFDPVRSRETRGERSSESPLQRLLNSVGSPTRGAALEAPADWSIQRLTVRSVTNSPPAPQL